MSTVKPTGPIVGETSPANVDFVAKPQLPAILVVDDKPSKRLAIRAMLAPLGIEVIEVESGREALRAVVANNFAVVLMDVRMPTLDGYQTAKLIRQRTQSELTPIIFVTAFGSDELETADAYASGAVDFIFTPIRPDILRAKVAAFVGLFVQSQELERSLESITALNAALAASEIRARAVLQNVADGIVTVGDGGLIESFNPSAQALFGYPEQEVVGRHIELIAALSHRSQFSDAARAKWSLRDANGMCAESSETVGRRKDESTFSMEMDVSQMQIGSETFTIACFRDISGRKAYMSALERQALRDDRTGLPNRTLFCDRLDHEIAVADQADESRAVLLIDLDHFGNINERFGREKGDAILLAVARRLRGAMRNSDTVGQIGGDSFGVLPSGAADVGDAAAVAWKVREVFDHPFVFSGDSVELHGSVGIAIFPQDGSSAEELMLRAGLAVDQAKSSGQGLAVFAADPEDELARRLALLTELRAAIANDQLVLHYQPKVDLGGGLRTTGVEALVRWQHPADGLLMPGQFMPEAERSDLIEPLTTWVLNEALGQLRVWSEAGLDLTMAVNVSSRSLARGSNLPETIATLTRSWGIAPNRLVVELTENSIIDSDMAKVLEVLHEMGERVSIDDFGTGHSSLAYLHHLTVDEIKIDKSFVLNLPTVTGDATIVHSTIDLAHSLGLTVVAEGVEDDATLRILVEDGCDVAQGYFFSRPCAAEELTRWLIDSPFGARSKSSR